MSSTYYIINVIIVIIIIIALYIIGIKGFWWGLNVCLRGVKVIMLARIA